MLNAIIMASGFSNRMGTNKLLLPYKGKYLIEYIMDKVIKCKFNNVILVAHNKEIMYLGKKREMMVVYNERPEAGQSESIKLGIANSTEAEGYAFFTGDQPLIDIETIEFLIDNFYKRENSIIVPIFEEKRGTPVIFHRNFKKDLLALEGDTGGRNVIKDHMDAVKFIEVKRECILWDIDTKEDYRKLTCIDDL